MIDWSGPPIEVVGAGVGDPTAAARTALRRAEVVVAEPRFAHLLTEGQRRLDWPRPLSGLLELLPTQQGRRLALLASGDPLFFGIGRWLLRHLPREALVFHPGVSAVAVACAKVGWPWDEIIPVSLHGRPLAGLRARLQAHRRYALLTDTDNGVEAVARELAEARLDDSLLYVCEDLGGVEERCRWFSVDEVLAHPPEVHPLHVILLETAGPGGVLPEFPGLDDQAFFVEGERAMISKRVVRLAALSWLAPRAGDIGWDVGAGCGALAVEWARWNLAGEVHAVECHEGRATALEANRARFGVVGNLHLHRGRAPDVLSALPDPHAVFVGGGGMALATILRECWRRLRSGGRLVAVAVTEESRAELLRFAQGRPAHWQEVAVSEGDNLAGRLILRPALPVRLMSLVKP